MTKSIARPTHSLDAVDARQNASHTSTRRSSTTTVGREV